MLRSDRNIAERMFENNVTKVSSFVQISTRSENADQISLFDRFSAVPLHSLGESTCPLMPSSSKVLKSTILERVLSSTSAFSTFCKFSVELVRLPFFVLLTEVPADSPVHHRTSAIRGPGCRLHLYDERQIGSLRFSDFSATSNRIEVSNNRMLSILLR